MQPQAWVVPAGTVVAGPIPVAGAPDNPAGSKKISAGFADTLLDAATVAGLEGLFRFDIAAGALAVKDIVVAQKVRVIDAWLVLRGAGVATTTLTVETGAGVAITDAMAASGANKAIVRAATLDAAQWEIAAGGTLRVESKTGATQPDATVFVRVINVP